MVNHVCNLLNSFGATLNSSSNNNLANVVRIFKKRKAELSAEDSTLSNKSVRMMV